MLIREKASATREDFPEDGSPLIEAATNGKSNFLNQRGDLDNTSQDVIGVMITLIHGLLIDALAKASFYGPSCSPSDCCLPFLYNTPSFDLSIQREFSHPIGKNGFLLYGYAKASRWL
jgi:hypothetical protein